MMTNTKIGTALVGGYLLGRTKKAKLAVGLGMVLAGKKLNLEPRELLRIAAANPLVNQLNEQVRTELFGATKTAASSALTQRVNRLADSLHERAQGLTAPADAAEETAGRAAKGAKKRVTRAEPAEDGHDRLPEDEHLPEDDEHLDDEHPDDEADAYDDAEADDDAEDDEPRPAARRATRSTSSATKSAAKKTSAARRPAQAAGSSTTPASGARKKTAAKSTSSSGGGRRSTGTRRSGGDRG
ncbi:hypothetical protein [Streptomyces sp. NPDC060194]|uniref:hypothetical protein n=1 Tax=Streptomyces sp. NPDC060194 TaxID=3347069 RepID=UPI0036695C9F